MRSCQRLICGQIEMSTLNSGFDVDIMMINCVSVAQYENLLAFGIVLCKTTFFDHVDSLDVMVIIAKLK